MQRQRKKSPAPLNGKETASWATAGERRSRGKGQDMTGNESGDGTGLDQAIQPVAIQQLRDRPAPVGQRPKRQISRIACGPFAIVRFHAQILHRQTPHAWMRGRLRSSKGISRYSPHSLCQWSEPDQASSNSSSCSGTIARQPSSRASFWRRLSAASGSPCVTKTRSGGSSGLSQASSSR